MSQLEKPLQLKKRAVMGGNSETPGSSSEDNPAHEKKMMDDNKSSILDHELEMGEGSNVNAKEVNSKSEEAEKGTRKSRKQKQPKRRIAALSDSVNCGQNETDNLLDAGETSGGMAQDEDSSSEIDFDKMKPWTNYEMAAARNALRLQHQIETGEFDPNAPDEDSRPSKRGRRKGKSAELEKKYIELRAIETAKSLCEITINIQETLHVNKQPHDVVKAVKLLKDIYATHVTPLTLKYAPSVVDTVSKLRGYANSREVQEAAEKCYNRFHALFPIPEGQTFESVFHAAVKQLEESNNS